MFLPDFQSGQNAFPHIKKVGETLAKLLQTSATISPTSQGKFVHGIALDRIPIVSELLRMSQFPCLFFLNSKFEEEDLGRLKEILFNLDNTKQLPLLFVFGDLPLIQKIRFLVREKIEKVDAYDVIVIGREELALLLLGKNPPLEFKKFILRFINLPSLTPYFFISRGAIEARSFFGREGEIRQITRHLEHTSFAVIGGRRIGKTSLLHRLHETRLPNAGYRTLYMDCSSVRTEEDFLHLELTKIGKPLILLLDEADKLAKVDCQKGWPIFSALRSLVNEKKAQVVLAGERILRMGLSDHKSPLYNLTNEIVLGCLDYPAIHELITKPFRELAVELSDEESIIRRIWEFTSGQPSVAQLFCQHLVTLLYKTNSRRITFREVNEVMENPDFQIAFLQTFWEGACSLEKVISFLIAEKGGFWNTTQVRQTLSERSQLTPPNEEINDALQCLTHLRNILKITSKGYELKVGGFSQVIENSNILEDLRQTYLETYKKEKR